MRLNNLKSLIRRFLKKDLVERELDEEIQAYLQQDIERRIAHGLTRDEARREALAEAGAEATKERVRDARTLAWIDGLIADLRYAARIAIKRPGVSVLAVLTMALGIGSAVAIFSVIDGVLLRPLPFRKSDRLVSIFATVPAWRTDPILSKVWDQIGMTYIQYTELAKRQTRFEEISLIRRIRAALVERDERRQVQVGRVAANFFSLLGVNAITGRLFSAADEATGSHPTVVLSYALWQRMFAGDADALGKTVTIAPATAAMVLTVVGVLPANFDFSDYGVNQSPSPDLWIPLYPTSLEFGPDEGIVEYSAIGILKPGVSAADAEQEAGPIVDAAIPAQYHLYGMDREGVRIAQRLREQTAGVKDSLWILMAVTGLLLIIACCNVANLLLGQAAIRRHEIALRVAIGASRRRIIRQLVTESALLSVLGGAIGTISSFWAVRILIRIAPIDIPRASDIGINMRVLFLTFLVSVLTGVLFGILPAWASTRGDLNSTLKSTGRAVSQSSRLQRLIMVGEISLSFALLIGASLLTQSLMRLSAATPAIRPDSLLGIEVDRSHIQNQEKLHRRFVADEVLEQLRSIPGVDAVTAASFAPFGGVGVAPIQIENVETPQSNVKVLTNNKAVLSNYFSVVGIPIIRGRSFTAAEVSDDAPVVIVNRALANKFWSVDTAITRRVRDGDHWYTIVGVCEDLRELEFAASAEISPTLYFTNSGSSAFTVLVRSSLDFDGLVPLIRREIGRVDKEVVVGRIQTVDSLIQKSMAPDRYRTILINIFAVAAVGLALVGLYGVVSRSIVQRTRELSIRIALGANPGDVVRMVLRQTLMLTAAGIAIGLCAAIFLTRSLSNFLFGIGVADGATYIGVAIGLLMVSLLATYLPARRASRTDPTIALRVE